MPLKREYFVMYNYGMGGLWGIAIAESERQIRNSFPSLEVFSERPKWMDDAILSSIRANSVFVVGEEDTYPEWLSELR